MIEMTVALPMFKAGMIANVTLEGLCRQTDIDFKWELIVAEETKKANNPLVFGKKRLMSYKKRLKEVGCERIVYIPVEEWIPLSHKWIDIYNRRAEGSKCFVLQAADCFPHSKRLAASMKAINNHFDWYQQESGYFYDIGSNVVAWYSLADTIRYHPCALNMTIDTAIMGGLEKEGIASGIDSWLFNRTKPKSVFLDKNIYEDGLDINGHNVISRNRKKLIVEGTKPFSKCDKTLEDIIPDPDIIKHLRKSRENLPAINTKFPDVTIAILWSREQKIFLEAASSGNKQVYPGICKVKFLDNQDGKYSVPEGYNKLVKECDTEYIRFLGDDDKLSKDNTLSLMIALEAAIDHKHKDPVCIVSNMTLVDSLEKHNPIPVQAICPGMWKTEWVREHPFDEEVKGYVSHNYHKTMQEEFGIIPIHAFWNYGYFYFQGKDNMSGNKFEIHKEEIGEEKNENKISKRQNTKEGKTGFI
ncbi:MAG: hypothetical protein U9O94_02180 [Nanoarchaeota archaeon]|nr:hypothetical protein [Nanoarchaeota archaeon]